MAGKKIQISDIERSDVNFVAGSRITNLPASASLPETSQADLDLEITRLTDTKVRLTGQDEITYARSDIQEGLGTLERILLQVLEKKEAREAQGAIEGVREEQQKKAPDLGKIKNYLGTLLRIAGMLHITPEKIGDIKDFIVTLGAKMGIGL